MINSLVRLVAVTGALLLVAVSVGIVSVHAHEDSSEQSCTLCQAVHLPGSLASVPALSRPVLQTPVVAPNETQRIFHELSPSLTYRGPPSL